MKCFQQAHVLKRNSSEMFYVSLYLGILVMGGPILIKWRTLGWPYKDLKQVGLFQNQRTCPYLTPCALKLQITMWANYEKQ